MRKSEIWKFPRGRGRGKRVKVDVNDSGFSKFNLPFTFIIITVRETLIYEHLSFCTGNIPTEREKVRELIKLESFQTSNWDLPLPPGFPASIIKIFLKSSMDHHRCWIN